MKKISINLKKYKDILKVDYEFNASFRNCKKLPKSFTNSYEWKIIKCYRLFQVCQETIFEKILDKKLKRYELKTGICFEGNTTIGKGLIIGHWGRIIINKEAVLGNGIFITHGVTIGRDIRGKRKGCPIIGNNVCIRNNSTIVGHIKIGDDVLIAPNTFVNFDVPSHSIVIGNPASIHYKENATEGHLGKLNINNLKK